MKTKSILLQNLKTKFQHQEQTLPQGKKWEGYYKQINCCSHFVYSKEDLEPKLIKRNRGVYFILVKKKSTKTTFQMLTSIPTNKKRPTFVREKLLELQSWLSYTESKRLQYSTPTNRQVRPSRLKLNRKILELTDVIKQIKLT